MGKAKIAIIIILLLTATGLLIVSLIDKNSLELVALPNHIKGEHGTTKSRPLTPENHVATMKKENLNDGINDSVDGPANELYEKPPSSGLDIMTNQEHLAQRFNNEGKDYHWSGYWENELQTIVLFVGAKAFVKDSEVECKSSTCEVTVNLSVNGPENTVIALESLSQEFAQRVLKFVPDSIDPANGKVVFYTQPGDVPE